MIKVKVREIAEKFNITTAYQLQVFADFYPDKAAYLWKGDVKRADLSTLNKLCNLFKCTPNDILEFTPDEDDE
jgi:Cro/C1-type HTH DNA-binding domain